MDNALLLKELKKITEEIYTLIKSNELTPLYFKLQYLCEKLESEQNG